MKKAPTTLTIDYIRLAVDMKAYFAGTADGPTGVSAELAQIVIDLPDTSDVEPHQQTEQIIIRAWEKYRNEKIEYGWMMRTASNLLVVEDHLVDRIVQDLQRIVDIAKIYFDLRNTPDATGIKYKTFCDLVRERKQDRSKSLIAVEDGSAEELAIVQKTKAEVYA